MTEQEKLALEIDRLKAESEQAKADANAARLEALRLQVATEKGLPAPLAGRLNGTTKEELEADADGLLELVKQDTPPPRRGSTDASAGTRQLSDANTPKISDVSSGLAQLAGEYGYNVDLTNVAQHEKRIADRRDRFVAKRREQSRNED
jgi:hypothetical protein